MSVTFKAVLFDWAYTLVNLVNENERDPMRRVYDRLVSQGHSLQPFDAFYNDFHRLFYGMIGASRESGIEARFDRALNYQLLANGVHLSEPDELRVLVHEFYEPMYSRRQVYDDVLPVLQDLRDGDYRLAIISNTTNPGYMKDLERVRSGLDPFFEFSIYSSEVPFRKPHPSIFELALRRMDLSADQVVYVGDNLVSDVQGAQSVSIKAVWLNRNGENVSGGIRPDFEITRLTDLLPIVSS